ncbi:MAG: DNA repair protein RadA [Xanthomonadales bacterium]|nr:DNA repair protein RadA [Xanthomonadales bacterium]
MSTARPKSRYVCSECGAVAPKWAGQCGDCGAWNSLIEEVSAGSGPGSRRGGYAGAASAGEVSDLASVASEQEIRMDTGLAELNRVLGGGLVSGSVVLVGGDPGIGKSTLMLQVHASLQGKAEVIYVSGEESLGQIAQRARRLQVEVSGLRCQTETNVERILATAIKEKPKVLIIDSIQTLWLPELTSAPGSVSQVRECAARLVRYAKEQGVSVFLIGHVTKEGGIAGPRVLEHMVDAVLYFEGESGSRFRILRSLKNRFGAVNELGVFAMTDRGLREVPNPSAIFLSGQAERGPGSIVMVTREGTRPLLVEVQALVDQSPLANPRRVTVGYESNRLALLLAVAHRHGGVAIYDQDVFVNIVGGIRVSETAADLPVLLAVHSSFRNRSLGMHTMAFGEVGLSGEIRPIPNGEERLREAATHGFKRAIVPAQNRPKKGMVGEMEVIGAQTLTEALDAAAE